DVAAGAPQAQRVARGEVHRLHAPGQRPKRAVGQLRENRRHFEDAHTKLEDGRLVRLELAARSHLWSFLPRPGSVANLAGVQNADNVPTSPQIDPCIPPQLEQQTPT